MTIESGTILIADDDPGFRVLVANLFTRAGFVTRETASGEGVMAAVRAERPALVILDVALPDVNGFELCRELRDEFGDELPIVFLSGERTEPVDRAVGLLVGGDDYIVKPFDPDELLARARRLISRFRRERRSLVAAPSDLGLTRRELEVLRCLAEGLGPPAIASQLFISPKTVACHVQHVLAKLGVHSRAQAVAFAYEYGLLKASTDHEPAAAAVELRPNGGIGRRRRRVL